MLNLIKIECQKARYSKTVFLAAIICFIAILGFGFFLKQDTFKFSSNISQEEKQLQKEYDSTNNWKQQLKIRQELNSYIYSDKETIAMENELLQYRIDHDIAPSEKNTTWNFISYSFQIIGFLISVFAILFAIESIVKEFSYKTTKLLFTTPFSRTQILLSKYFTNVLLLVSLSIVFFLFAYISGGIYFTFSGAGDKNVFLFFGEIQVCREIQYSMINFLSTLINALLLMTIAFFLAILCRSQTIPLISSLGIMIFGTTIANKLYAVDMKWIRFSFLSNLSLQKYMDTPVKNNNTLLLYICVVVIHLLAFIIGGTLIIKKSDL